mgnify:CR=1 FL=1|tara:strand:+ start:105 stop:953 length:849 start_codon:yes stop_codon:yes gene_type:complete
MSKKNNIHSEVSKLLKKTIINKFNPNIDIHPVRIMQSVKSLIGIDLDLNYSSVLTWANQYLDDNIVKSVNRNYKVDKLEMLSIYDLEEKIRMKKSKDAIIYLKRLLLVSDGKNILEFLLELSLLQTGKSALIIWNIIKSLYFLKFKNLDIALAFGINSMISDDFILNTNQIKFKNEIDWGKKLISNKEQIHLIIMLHQINVAQFTRKEKIINNVSVMLNNIKSCKESDFEPIISSFKSKKELLLYFIDNINIINVKQIIYLDFLRIVFDNFSKEIREEVLLT